MERRTFLTGSAAFAASLASPVRSAPRFPIGIQLYTVAAEMAKDLPGTLKAVHDIGYREVETAGFTGLSAKEFRKRLDDAGLKCASCHLPLADGDWQGQFDIAHTLGAHYAVASTMFNQKAGKNAADITGAGDRAAFDAMTQDMNRIGAAAVKAGLQFAYHNHDFEFKKFGDGQIVYDLLLKQTDKDLVKLEIDCGWMILGGHDPIATMRRNPGRVRMLHIKDFATTTTRPSTTTDGHQGTELGRGFIDYKPVLAEAQRAGVQHYFVEQEPPFVELPALAAAKADYDYLHALS